MNPLSKPIARRTVLTGVAGAAAATVANLPSVDAAPAHRLRPYTMAMHIHASFSEGGGSFESHLYQARRHGVDVIWWTDHDFRVAAHDHRRAVNFDGPTELENELAWTWKRKDAGTLAAATAEFVESPRVGDAGKALRLAATGGADAGGSITYSGTAWNFTYNAAIGDTTLEIDVLPEQLGPDAVFFLHADLSHHPERGGRPAGVYSLRYRVGGASAARHSTDGVLGTVDLPAPPGAWSTLRLDLARDVHELWPDLVTGDNALRNLRVGVDVGAGVGASVVVDQLRFHRARRAGQAGEDLRAEVLAEYAAEYPDIAHYRAYEISMTRHLNWFGGDQTLPSFPSPPYRDNDVALTESMIDFLHRHGGLVCWNHPLDVEKPDTLAKLMIERNNLGADIVEIGRNPQAELLTVFDIAARNAVFFTAVGASDDHEGQDWLSQPQRNITGVWARSTRMSDLIAALDKGRAWFVDPAAYRGSLDIRRDDDSVMGGVAVTRSRSVRVELLATDLPEGAQLEIVTGVVDLAGAADLTPKTTVQTVQRAELRRGAYRLDVRVGDGVFVRTQVRSAAAALVAVSNPLWLLRQAPAHGVPASRRVSCD